MFLGEHTRQGSRTASVPDGTASAAAAPIPAAHPYSTRAYRARLTHGAYTSVRELTRAAYAPVPLQVLTDLLRLAADGDTGSRPHETQQLGAGSSASSPAARAGARHALSRARDVQLVLHAVLAEARDTVAAAETLGDAGSHAGMAELLAQLDALAAAADAAAAAGRTPLPSPALPGAGGAHVCNHDDEVEGRAAGSMVPAAAAAPWVLPAAAHAALLHGLLRLAAVTGARLQALSALEDLIQLQERQLRGPTSSDHAADAEETFSMDDAVALVDAAAQEHVEPVTAQDHVCAMQACANEHHRDFATALSLYRRFLQHAEAGRFAATAGDMADALVALAHSSRTTAEFTELRALLVGSEVAAAVPVSVPLYTALIDAASRAVAEPQRMSIALSLYRRLRDGGLTPTADTYAALIACCASTREPTHAFAFYHEARHVCGVGSFTPHVYTNLLLSYSAAGYGADARKTLDMLVEAGAPLSRAGFHAVLAGAVTAREAQEVLQLMTERYHIAPTPHTYAYVVQAVARAPAGVRTALQLFDLHEGAVRALAQLSDGIGGKEHRGGSYAGVDETTTSVHGHLSAGGVALEPVLLGRFPLYVRTVESALLRLRVDLEMDRRLKPYLVPLLRIAQQRMNAFVGMPPQSPTRVPHQERLCIAVLAADVLADVDAWVMPFVTHYSVLVIPYSVLVSLQQASGRRVEGAMAKGAQAGLHDPVWQETAGGEEADAVVEHRRRRLTRFLAQYKDVIHLVSLEEELRWSRETRRYGVGVTDLFARAAVTALHLARQGTTNSSGGSSSSLYAQHPTASIVLVSTQYERCGKYVVALKQAYADRRTPRSQQGGGHIDESLRAALRRVSYHNPRTNPNWVPPTLAIPRHPSEGTAKGKEAPPAGAHAEENAERRHGTGRGGSAAATHQRAPQEVLGMDAAQELYKASLRRTSSDSPGLAVASVEATRRSADVATASLTPSPTSADGEDALDAALLMNLLNEA